MKKTQKVMSQMRGQDKNLRKTTKWSGDRQSSRKRIQTNSKDDPGFWAKNGGKDWEDDRNVYQRPRRTKEKNKEVNNTPEGINSRITKAEQINDLEDRKVEITATEQNIEKGMKRNKDSLRDLWDNIKCTNIHIIQIPEGEERQRTTGKYLKK